MVHCWIMGEVFSVACVVLGWTSIEVLVAGKAGALLVFGGLNDMVAICMRADDLRDVCRVFDYMNSIAVNGIVSAGSLIINARMVQYKEHHRCEMHFNFENSNLIMVT